MAFFTLELEVAHHVLKSFDLVVVELFVHAGCHEGFGFRHGHFLGFLTELVTLQHHELKLVSRFFKLTD